MRVFELEIKTDDTILVIAPHPDDESIGAGGLLSMFSEQCTVWIMTDGRYGNERYCIDEMIQTRKAECASAMEMAGITDYKFFDYEDGTLIQHKDCFEKVDFSKFSFVFLPNPHDNHSDHTAVYEYAIEEIKKQKNIRAFLYEVHTPLADITCYLDVSNVIGRKKGMVNSYSSQMEMHPYGDQIVSLAKYRGFQNEQPEKYLETYYEILIENVNQPNSGVEMELAKYKQFTRIMSNWIRLKNQNCDISSFLLNKGYKEAAIYGYGVLGKQLLEELKSHHYSVSYIIDKNENICVTDMPVYHRLDNLRSVDIVIITTLNSRKEIEEELLIKGNLKSISFEKILEEM